MSNSYLFERLGWRGILVEPIPELADACRRNRPACERGRVCRRRPRRLRSVQFEIAPAALDHSSLSLDRHQRAVLERLTGGAETRLVTVPARTLDMILEEANAPKLDFVTVDVEGHEWEVLQGFTLDQWKPEIVILERNASAPNRRICRHMAHTDTAMSNRPVRKTGHAANDWFRRVSPQRLATRYWVMLETTVLLPAHARSWQAQTGYLLRGFSGDSVLSGQQERSSTPCRPLPAKTFTG